MKRFPVLLFFALLCASASWAAAPWDGTRGNITVSTSSTDSETAIDARTSDATVDALYVIIYYYAEPGKPLTMKTAARLIPPSWPKFNPVKAVFQIPESQIVNVTITEFRQGQFQVFTSNQ